MVKLLSLTEICGNSESIGYGHLPIEICITALHQSLRATFSSASWRMKNHGIHTLGMKLKGTMKN